MVVRNLLIALCLLGLSACGEETSRGALGAWVLDRPAMVEGLRALGYERPMAEQQAAALGVRLVGRADGTFQEVRRRSGEPEEVRTGTWSWTGEGALLRTTHADGVALESPQERVWHLADDRLRPAGAGAAGLVLRRDP